MRKVNKDILFLAGIIVLCFGFLLFHINPYYAEPYATLKERINLKVKGLSKELLTAFG